MKKTTFLLLLFALPFMAMRKDGSLKGLGVYQFDYYGQLHGWLPSLLIGSDDLPSDKTGKHIQPFNFTLEQTQYAYMDAITNQYRILGIQNLVANMDTLSAHAGRWKLVSIPLDKEAAFQQCYRFGRMIPDGKDANGYKPDYFPRAIHRKGDIVNGKVCEEDEQFYMDPLTGILEGSDYCGNFMEFTPPKQIPPPTTPKRDTTLLTVTGQAPTGQSVYSYSSNVNTFNPNNNVYIYNMGSVPGTQQAAPTKEVVYVQDQNSQRRGNNCDDRVRTKANAWEVIAGATGIVNTGLGIYNALKRPENNTYLLQQQQPIQYVQQPRTVYVNGNNGGYYGGNSGYTYTQPPEWSGNGNLNPRYPTAGVGDNGYTYNNGTGIPRTPTYSNGGFPVYTPGQFTSTQSSGGCPIGYHTDQYGNCVPDTYYSSTGTNYGDNGSTYQ